MELMYQGAVAEGRVSLNRWVEMCSTAPAKMFGLYPKKGTIAPAPMPIWSCSIPTAPTTCRPKPTT